MRIVRLLAVGGLLSIASRSGAQQVPQIALASQPVLAAVPTGSVTGRIVCSDTQRPARFADVMLVPVPIGTNTEERGRLGRGANARTDLEGNFLL